MKQTTRELRNLSKITFFLRRTMISAPSSYNSSDKLASNDSQIPQLFLQRVFIKPAFDSHSLDSHEAHSAHSSSSSTHFANEASRIRFSPFGSITHPSSPGPLHRFDLSVPHQLLGHQGSSMVVPCICKGISKCVVGSSAQVGGIK
jgi:hypothetical protein